MPREGAAGRQHPPPPRPITHIHTHRPPRRRPPRRHRYRYRPPAVGPEERAGGGCAARLALGSASVPASRLGDTLGAGCLVAFRAAFSIVLSAISGKVIHLIPGENDRLIAGNGELRQSGRERREETLGRERCTPASLILIYF